ncbi:hypothetical protein FOMPIDRAFT_88605 [Fomitopsis schrenkii]|uniref:Uncharacterized protein n=1 Tax=Fomitopsis schrenkii TaxID=2126942 RepID=S8E3G5_FOMSC|nr:hypothetical protein FOMPIDRAFT_88605 [Fomitopsis schrenkii]
MTYVQCALLELYCHVTAAKPGSLLSPFVYHEIKEMLDYFDEVFKDHDAPEIERCPILFEQPTAPPVDIMAPPDSGRPAQR